jgi:hypothetical protein
MPGVVGVRNAYRASGQSATFETPQMIRDAQMQVAAKLELLNSGAIIHLSIQRATTRQQT